MLSFDKMSTQKFITFFYLYVLYDLLVAPSSSRSLAVGLSGSDLWKSSTVSDSDNSDSSDSSDCSDCSDSDDSSDCSDSSDSSDISDSSDNSGRDKKKTFVMKTLCEELF